MLGRPWQEHGREAGPKSRRGALATAGSDAGAHGGEECSFHCDEAKQGQMNQCGSAQG